MHPIRKCRHGGKWTAAQIHFSGFKPLLDTRLGERVHHIFTLFGYFRDAPRRGAGITFKRVIPANYHFFSFHFRFDS